MLKVLVSDADTFQEMIGALTAGTVPQRIANRRLFVAIKDAKGDVAAIAGGGGPELAAQVSGARGRTARGRTHARVRARTSRPGSRSST